MIVEEGSQHLAPGIVKRSDSGELHHLIRLSTIRLPSVLLGSSSKIFLEKNLCVHRTNENAAHRSGVHLL
jgi:hypothetical protein